MTTPILKVTELQKYFPIQGKGLFNRVVGNVPISTATVIHSCHVVLLGSTIHRGYAIQTQLF